MSDQVTLKAELRTVFGKGAARRLRGAGKLPGVVYGHGKDVQHITVDTHELFLAIKGQTNVVLNLEIAGKDTLVLVKDIQIDPVHRILEHIDFVIVKKGEKVSVEVPVVIEGEVAGKAVATVELLNIMLTVSATAIPETIVVNVDGLGDGDVVRVSDLDLPANAECDLDAEEAVVTVAVPPEEPEAEEEAAEGEEADEAAAEEADEASAE